MKEMAASSPKTSPPRTLVNFWADAVLLVAAVLTFGVGLVLLLCFHMGEGAFATSAFGVERLTWLNLHRLVATLVLASTGMHAALHWEAIATRVWLTFAGPARKRAAVEVVLYASFSIVVLTGFVVWILVGQSTPPVGPVVLAKLTPERHRWVDVHNLVGLLALGMAVRHMVRRWRWMTHAAARVMRIRQSTPADRAEDVVVRTEEILLPSTLLLVLGRLAGALMHWYDSWFDPPPPRRPSIGE